MNIHRRRAQFNAQQLSLFVWGARERADFPYPARVLANRYGWPIERAALIAELAGLGSRDDS
jgi:hypothetical protein